MKHLIFFDDECPVCQRAVQKLIELDRDKLFGFAPLNGETAKQHLSASLQNANSLVLIENFMSPKPRTWIRARGLLRILWLIGGLWRLVAWMYVLPFGLDFFYKLFATHRHKFGVKPVTREDKTRFLP